MLPRDAASLLNWIVRWCLQRALQQRNVADCSSLPAAFPPTAVLSHCREQYGSPVCVLDLVKRVERRPRESVLGQVGRAVQRLAWCSGGLANTESIGPTCLGVV